jgi:hypothetical protein
MRVMYDVPEVNVLICWVRAKLDHRNQHGFTAVEWLLVALGVIAIAGIAVAAVKAYVTAETNKLGSP